MPDKVLAALDQIRRAIAILVLVSAVVELRILHAGREGTISGYFTNLEQLALAAYQNDGKAPGIYITLNPVLPDLIARANNRTKSRVSDTTKDEHILERRWLLIDVDPKRPRGISSTDAEHEAAIQRAREIRAWLTDQGFPDPVLVDSGNGAHLLYRVDLPNDEESRTLIHNILRALGPKFDDDKVEVDQTTFNAARICKLAGTVARKGDSIPERPHRLAQILDAPDEIRIVPRDLLDKLAAEAPAEAHRKPATRAATADTASSGAYRAEAFINEWGITIKRGPVSDGGGQKYIIDCPFNSDHDNAAIFEGADGKLGFHCFHNSCAEYDWKALRSHFDPEYRTRNEQDDARPNATDVGNAKRFVARYRAEIRYCKAWNTWLFWEGTRWRRDDTGEIERRAKATARAMFREAESLMGDARTKLITHALKSEHEQRIKAMIALARSEPGISVRPDDLDHHPYMLNVQNGTIDLRTGELRPHRREDLITKLAPVEYNAAAKAPIFIRFLIRIMNGRRGLVRFIQRALGYSMTGSCVEQMFFVAYGTGQNGKSTLMTIFHEVLGPDYAADTPASTFAAKQFEDGIPNDIARLKGVRFATASEFEGRKLDEARIKKYTGQELITARFLHSEYFQYMPEFVVWLVCNVRPVIESSSDSMWRRVGLIPFKVRIPDDRRDKALLGKLRRERAGILAWCVRGAVAWYKFGLGTPESVVTATEAYRTEMDPVSRFMSDCCEEAEGARTAASVLYNAYKLWSGKGGETPVAQRAFGLKLTERGLQRVRGEAGIAYVGVTLRQERLNELNQLNEDVCSPLTSSSIGEKQEKVHPERISFSQPGDVPRRPPDHADSAISDKEAAS